MRVLNNILKSNLKLSKTWPENDALLVDGELFLSTHKTSNYDNNTDDISNTFMYQNIGASVEAAGENRELNVSSVRDALEAFKQRTWRSNQLHGTLPQ